KLRPVAAPDPQRLRQLLDDLDSAQFAVRQNASRELEKQRELAEPALRAALAKQPSAEVRRRLEQLLEKLGGPLVDPEQLRGVRAIEALEYIGSAEARALLQTLA